MQSCASGQMLAIPSMLCYRPGWRLQLGGTLLPSSEFNMHATFAVMCSRLLDVCQIMGHDYQQPSRHGVFMHWHLVSVMCMPARA